MSAITATYLLPADMSARSRSEDDGEPFEGKMARLAAQWREQQAEAQGLDVAIAQNLARLRFGT